MDIKTVRESRSIIKYLLCASQTDHNFGVNIGNYSEKRYTSSDILTSLSEMLFLFFIFSNQTTNKLFYNVSIKYSPQLEACVLQDFIIVLLYIHGSISCRHIQSTIFNCLRSHSIIPTIHFVFLNANTFFTSANKVLTILQVNNIICLKCL